MEKSIINQFWAYVESQDTKLSKRVYNWLNEDNLNDIWLDRNIFWWDLNSPSSNSMPNFVYDYIKKWGNSLGYTYTFDL